MTLAEELRVCLGELLDTGVPSPDESDEPVRFFRQWLAERNLGLVPIADPASFDWAGKWIAVVDGPYGRHAVVMFGSPSGVWLDPANAYKDGVRIVAGWMLTPLDLGLPTHMPYGTARRRRNGRGDLDCLGAGSTTNTSRRCGGVAGRGLEGDRYANGDGTFTRLPVAVTNSHWSRPTSSLRSSSPGRTHVATSSRPASHSTHSSVSGSVGPVECGRRLAEPCAHLEKLARPGLLRPLVHRGGLRADILGGKITVGDEIT